MLYGKTGAGCRIIVVIDESLKRRLVFEKQAVYIVLIQYITADREVCMLVLSRKPGERIHIGSDVVITVLEVSGRLVRIGVDAPRSVSIFRAEVFEQIEEENRLAAEKSGYFDKLRRLSSLLGPRKKQDD